MSAVSVITTNMPEYVDIVIVLVLYEQRAPPLYGALLSDVSIYFSVRDLRFNSRCDLDIEFLI
jgi:hypothetical protein